MNQKVIPLVRTPTSEAEALPDWRVSYHPTRTGAGTVSITMPDNVEWHLLWVWAEFITDATVDDRQLVLEILDPNSELELEVRVGAVQTASQTRRYSFGPSLADLLAFRDTNWLMTPIPPTLILSPRSIIRLRNNAAVIAGDQLSVRLGYAARRIG